MTVDEGRIGALELNQLAAGVVTMQILDDRRGRNWRPKVKQWFREWKYAAKCAVEEGVPWALKYWRAAQPGAVGGSKDDQEPGTDQTEPGGDDKPTDGKQTDE